MARRAPHLLLLSVVTLAALAAACGGAQSALDPAGRDAERIANLTTWLTAGLVLIWTLVVGLALYASFAAPRLSPAAARGFILGGGVVFPVVVLSVLLVFNLSELRGLLAAAPPGGMSLEVVGTQWWWRVRYIVPGREPIELANEIRLPVGRRVNVRLESADVVHSFWIPSLAGKIDMIPGRINRLALEPTRTGTFRGACAEYCGTSHARMNLVAVVTGQEEFDRWLAEQARPAVPPGTEAARRGEEAFFERGCATCHTVRGTRAVGAAGPDLTHVGSRETIAAGLLPADRQAFERWISRTRALKPDARMPAFAALPPDVLSDLSAYLVQLQ